MPTHRSATSWTRRAIRVLERRLEFLQAKKFPNANEAQEIQALKLAIASVELVLSYGWVGLMNFGYPVLQEQFHDENEARRLGEFIEAAAPGPAGG